MSDATIEKSIAAKMHSEDERVHPKPAPPAPKVKEIKNLWLKIQQGLNMMNLDQNNSLIQEELKWLKNNQTYFNSVSKRAAPYLDYIVTEADSRGLPLELALMPVVESTYDPFAFSRAGASGLWQIMPGTADHFGLKQNWWYDGRRDVVAATGMALDYMEGLYDMFGDWELALAAYNSGPGRVQEAVRKNKRKGKPTDFWSLDLPKETTAYVPKLIAICKVIQNPSNYGIKLPSLPNQPVFKIVDTEGQIDMAQASKLANISLNELYKLNPGMNRWSTPPGGPYYLAIPIDKVDIFKKKLKKLPSDKRVRWQRYTVKSGDSLSKIAKTYRTRTKLITEVNQLESSMIRIGQTLLIPVPAKSADAYSLTLKQRQLAKQNRNISGKQKYTYVVKPGDSFWLIAKKYNVKVSQLARWNSMSARNTLRVNQRLVVWTPAARTNKVVRRVKYQVKNGDNLSLIAEKFNLNVNEIKDWNTLNQKYIHPGQQLTLYVDVTQNYD
ncbi:MAG: LysM peptidoglycan-binding domain-containing protein [Endozoicomonas sp. (ex Botrylloides leachii)]|nr:LysM peptidoglycan-binding domain-containing protein [Endozoicomonas sp. (ex Botrylloides leachii)]